MSLPYLFMWLGAFVFLFALNLYCKDFLRDAEVEGDIAQVEIGKLYVQFTRTLNAVAIAGFTARVVLAMLRVYGIRIAVLPFLMW